MNKLNHWLSNLKALTYYQRMLKFKERYLQVYQIHQQQVQIKKLY